MDENEKMKKCGNCKKAFVNIRNAGKYCSLPCVVEGNIYVNKRNSLEYSKMIKDWKRENPEELEKMYERIRKKLMDEGHL